MNTSALNATRVANAIDTARDHYNALPGWAAVLLALAVAAILIVLVLKVIKKTVGKVIGVVTSLVIGLFIHQATHGVLTQLIFGH